MSIALAASGRDTEGPGQVRADRVVTIDGCRQSIADHQWALPRAKRSLRRQLDEMFVAAIGERFLVEQKLLKRWQWCDQHTGHALLAEREAACIETLGEYVAWSDVIRDMCSELGLSGARCQ